MVSSFPGSQHLPTQNSLTAMASTFGALAKVNELLQHTVGYIQQIYYWSYSLSGRISQKWSAHLLLPEYAYGGLLSLHKSNEGTESMTSTWATVVYL